MTIVLLIVVIIVVIGFIVFKYKYDNDMAIAYAKSVNYGNMGRYNKRFIVDLAKEDSAKANEAFELLNVTALKHIMALYHEAGIEIPECSKNDRLICFSGKTNQFIENFNGTKQEKRELSDFYKNLQRFSVNNSDARKGKILYMIKNIMANYDPSNVLEVRANPKEDTTSYTIGKGKVFCICMRSFETDDLEDINTLKYVYLHELSHLATKALQHGKDFWHTFKLNMEIAVRYGLLDVEDYALNPIRYCNFDLNDNVLLNMDINTNNPEWLISHHNNRSLNKFDKGL